MSKYDRTNVPLEVKWLATDDGDKYAFGFRTKPVIGVACWLSNIDDVVNGITDLELTCKERWENSLEERPK